jgi:hypothetical protein
LAAEAAVWVLIRLAQRASSVLALVLLTWQCPQIAEKVPSKNNLCRGKLPIEGRLHDRFVTFSQLLRENR